MKRDAYALARFLTVALFACAAALANAHSDGEAAGGFLSGYIHPLSGLDHLLAMVAVGIWGATLGRPLIWALPIAFPVMMVVGGILGIARVPLPFVEIGVALSVIVLGLSIALAWRAPVPVAVAIVAVFAIFHGHAHGTELPVTGQPAAYAVGFVISTGLLHLAGIAIGSLKSLRYGAQLLRVAGAAIAVTGVWIFMGLMGVSYVA